MEARLLSEATDPHGDDGFGADASPNTRQRRARNGLVDQKDLSVDATLHAGRMGRRDGHEREQLAHSAQQVEGEQSHMQREAAEDGVGEAGGDGAGRISYDSFCNVRDEFAAKLGAGGSERLAHYFAARTFNRFERDQKGRIHARTFMEFVVRHVALTQSRINLSCHDADADGWLTEVGGSTLERLEKPVLPA